ncbi:MAG: hypothetical protein KatS3mg032_1029 [Cyclobacteriaceae bacterium]|nr:MAG: hypothetical protein KatS3mg032_1029 [Cyclobacteriaceae bacterium]
MGEDKKHSGLQGVGDAIRDLLRTYRLEKRFNEAALIAAWPEMVGEAIARRTRKVYIQKGVLYVELNSSAMKSDFLLHKQHVLKLIQQKFGRDIISDIIIR